MLTWLGIWSSTFCGWKRNYGKAYEHNGWIPRDHWLESWEKDAIVQFHHDHPLEGYRRLTYMMLDANVVAVSAASVYRVLSQAGLMRRNQSSPSKKGTGFQQPESPHLHWHVDIAHLNIRGTFYYLTSVLDGHSRYVVHHEIRERMTEVDIETILQRAREKFPEAKPRIISDNGPQFVAKDFKEFVRICGMSHVRTSPYYPQSNGKLERFHRTLKSDCVRPQTPLTLEDGRRVVAAFIEEYNTARLHSALGYVTPRDVLEGRQKEIFADRDAKLEAARQQRAKSRAAARSESYTIDSDGEDRALLGSNSSAPSSPLASSNDQDDSLPWEVIQPEITAEGTTC